MNWETSLAEEDLVRQSKAPDQLLMQVDYLYLHFPDKHLPILCEWPPSEVKQEHYSIVLFYRLLFTFTHQ